MDPETEALDLFGQAMMVRVRDATIHDWDAVIDGTMKSAPSQAIHEQIRDLGDPGVALVRTIVPQIVDTTLHYVLWLLEQDERVIVTVRTASGEVDSVRDVSDGLSGELYGNRGWIARFSKERAE